MERNIQPWTYEVPGWFSYLKNTDHDCSSLVNNGSSATRIEWHQIDYGTNFRVVDIFSLMMTSLNGNIFQVTGPLCGEFNGHRWIPLTKASDAELWCFVDLRLNTRLSKQLWGWWFETKSIRSVIFLTFQYCQNAGYLSNTPAAFDMSCRSSAVMTPIKYQSDSKHKTRIFAKS